MALRLTRLTLAIVILAAIPLSALGLSCSSQGYSGPVEPITVGKIPTESGALIFVAEAQGFFEANGLQTTIRDYSSGPVAIDALKGDEVQFAVASEYSVVSSVFDKEGPAIITSIDKYITIDLIARKDRAISSVSDLKGKKVGLVKGTILEFYLARFLELNGMNIRDVVQVDTKLTQLADAISNGEVEAVISNEPYATAVKGRLGDNSISWPAQSFQPANIVVVCSKDWVTGHQETVVKFLKALTQAEKYLDSHQPQAKEIVREQLNLDSSYVEGIWAKHQFSLSLDGSLIAAMEDEARWMIKNNLTTEKQVPDFNDHIYEDALKKVKPEAVNIIR